MKAVLGAAAGAFLAAHWIVPALLKIGLRRRFLADVRAKGFVHLTFDDGPDPAATPALLELLGRRGVKATFFLVGDQIEKHRELAAEIRQRGHEIGEHSQRHTNALRSDPWRTWSDLTQGGATVALAAPGQARTLFRPPYGKLNSASLAYALIARRRLAFWDLDPRDYDCATGEEAAARLRGRIAPGSVILLHDGRRNGRTNHQATVDAAGFLIDEAERLGLKFAPLGAALNP